MCAADILGRAVPFSIPQNHQKLLATLLRDHAVPLVDTILSDTHLLVLHFAGPLDGLPALSTREDDAVARPNTFRRRGRVWQFDYAGCESFLPAMLGVGQIHHLLAHAYEDIAAETVVRSAQDTVGLPVMSDAAALEHGLHQEADLGPVADPQTLEAAWKKLQRFDAEIEAAETSGDDRLAQRLRHEKSQFVAYLAATSGIRGHARRAGSPIERARQSCQRTTKAAIEAIADDNPLLAEHLRQSIHTGRSCHYSPAEPVIWQL
jgi:hypothetical protein